MKSNKSKSNKSKSNKSDYKSLTTLILILLVLIAAFFYFQERQTKPTQPSLRIIDFTKENVLELPPSGNPVLRIFDRGTERCIKTYENFKTKFNIDFECVPTENMSDEYLAAIYKFVTSPEYRNITYNATNNTFEEEAIFTTNIVAETATEKNVSEKLETNFTTIPLKNNTLTLFFIYEYILYDFKIPSEEDICKVANYDTC